MNDRAVAFYVHHDGAGHATRCAAIASHLPGPVSMASSADLAGRTDLGDVDVVRLPSDVPDGEHGDIRANGAFHWAPTRPDVALPRMRAILDWLARIEPAVVVVDVSVEVACVVRLAGIPVITVRQHGDRRDHPHRHGYRLSELLLAPFSAALEDPSTPESVRRKTTYCGVVGPEPPTADDRYVDGTGRPRVVVVWGKGTEPPPGPVLDRAALATPGWDWEIAGPPCPVRPPTMVRHRGWVDAVDELVAGADVVVGPPGNGLVALIARTGVPFVAVPADRPFDEQVVHAERLAATGVAVVRWSWPRSVEWPDVLVEAVGQGRSRVEVLAPRGGAGRAAAAVLAVAARADRCPLAHR